ncbi:MAG: hypothetical protein A2431_00085 [Candidatus Zambryskibacteria bacterium RIFOXYC1_FULL_39_10]|uniref:Sodium/calcium exchanger membrane region domain-containing protein n=1 Tax=Candidatus Zambryskibacteria bacterium RIFOXYC1_FULL_39_10 TaxID=1802779 RepID=A0A1G2UZM6_9BACT|nr:MAG: hypothetical protein A2431_00085 [Candidatus Zambryskibacteria bacterium RIFOXYC1_FULL_39_10]
MFNNLFIFIVALFIVVRGATYASRYAISLAESFNLSKYTIGFIIVAVISVLPETFIAINSALEGIPSFGLGTLFGSNIADLTLIFAIIVFLTGRSLKIESKILKNHVVFPFVLLLPIVLGLNGHFSRLEGLALIIAGGVFYYMALRDGTSHAITPADQTNRSKSFSLLLVSMVVLLVSSHFVVTSATDLAAYLGINPIIIGMFVVSLGTTMPELFFSLKSVMKKDDSLAVGDILGTVLADATIVVGILALINPFYFPVKIVYVTGVFMVIASLILFRLMKTGHALTRTEAYLLLAFWLFFVLVEYIVNVTI